MLASSELQKYSYQIALDALSVIDEPERSDRRLLILRHAIEDALCGSLSDEETEQFMLMALSVANRKVCKPIVQYAANVCFAALANNAQFTVLMSDVLLSIISKNCDLDEACADLMVTWDTEFKTLPSKIPLSAIMMKGHA